MAPQKNRRMLVAVTYTILVAFIAVFAVMPSWVHALGPFGRQLVVLAGVLLFLAPLQWLTMLTKFTPLGGRPTSVEITRLGLTPGPRDPYDPDERELAIRNAAYYQAFRVIMIYSFLLFLAPDFLHHLSDSTAQHWMKALLLLLFIIAWSLPQAIVVWTEPDAPEEDRLEPARRGNS
ncbi:MAG: hypothetical protein M1404_05455 [Acidobacteria bacterium]|nr:hypothetical protein [Acidobacteriota bacterium]